MKKIILLSLSASMLMAGWYDNKPSSNQERSQQQREQPQRGMEKPGDDHYLDNQIDKSIYGKNNSYQGSRPGDDDYGDRVVKGLMDR